MLNMLKMRKIYASLILICALLIINASALAAQERQQKDDEIILAPLSPAFLEWQKENDFRSTDYIPPTVDLSHLRKNPPVTSTALKHRNSAPSALPSKYDLREAGNYLTPIRDQHPYGACWAFAAIGAMESNYLMQGNPEIDLSEMHLAWFALKNPDVSKAFLNMNSASYEAVLNRGGNIFFSVATYSRLDGPVLEKDLPYPEQPSYDTPNAYNRVLRLRDVYYLSVDNSVDTQENIKRRIMEYGAVQVSYWGGDATSYSEYVKKNGCTTYYYDREQTNHAVLLIGWDDDFPKENFKNIPSRNGAWLVRNSWGPKWYNYTENVGDDGYFWMSYDQYITNGAAFIVENVESENKNESEIKCYYYDSLGWVSTINGKSYASNIFQAERDNETLTEIGFYTPDNNIEYEIEIYNGLSSLADNPDAKDSPTLLQTGRIPYAGYHTVALQTPVMLTEGEFFSVILHFKNTDMMPVERKVAGYTPNALIEQGSAFSSDGIKWSAGINYNACIKAFTITDFDDAVTPEIMTSALSGGKANVSYSQVLRASGTLPITWTLENGELPPGLSLSPSGIISGTPTGSGAFNITLKASNRAGSSSASLIINIAEGLDIKTKSLYGVQGYAFNETLEAVNFVGPVTWALESGALPSGLTLNANTGTLTGKPTKAGTFSPAFRASDSDGYITGTVEIYIEGKPLGPSISTSSFKKAFIGHSYSQALKVKGTQPITITASGVPNGLVFDSESFTLSGKPADTGTFAINFTAENRATELEGSPVTKKVRITVVKAEAPIIASGLSVLPEGTVGEEYGGVVLTTSSGTEPFTWTASDLPPGLQISDGGVIWGVPLLAGSFRPEVTVFNSFGIDRRTLSLEINEGADDKASFQILRERDISSLSAEELLMISDDVHNALLIAAILPEIRVNEEGVYDFCVSIDRAVPVGSELLWRSHFCLSEEKGEESDFAVFYDDTGEEIGSVPESYSVRVSVWLDAGDYEPFIFARLTSKNGNTTPSGGCNFFMPGFLFVASYTLVILAAFVGAIVNEIRRRWKR